MKKLITIIVLTLCFTATAQKPKEVFELKNKLLEIEKADRIGLDKILSQIPQLQNELKTLQSEVEVLKKEIAELKQQRDAMAINMEGIVNLLGITTYTQKELPEKFNKDEVGIAFVKEGDSHLSLAIYINNQWKLFEL